MRLRNRRNVVLVGLAISLIIGVIRATPASADSMRWRGSIPEASADARQMNRPLMLDFWADWCGACQVMEAEVYTDSDFVAASEDFVAVRINSDKEPRIARKYHITALPTLLFTDSYGNELFRYVGAMNARPLTELLRALPHDVTEFNRLNQLLDRDKNNFEALEGLGKNLRAVGLYLASNDYYERALQQSEVKTSPTKRQSILSDMGANYLEVKDGRHATNVFEKCLRDFPDSPQKQEWVLSLERARVMTGKKDLRRN